MAVPSINYVPSMESIYLTNLDNHISRWGSTSSLSTSSCESRSASSTGYPDCPAMSKSLTDSMSSDTQTENETPPESPREEGTPIQNTPVIREGAHHAMVGFPGRASLPNHLALYPESGEDSDETDAGYETESESKHAKIPLGKRPVARRITLDRTNLRQRGKLPATRPACGLNSRFPSGTHIPTPSHLATSTCPPSPNPNTYTNPRKGSLSRPGRPTKIALLQSAPPTFPKSSSKAPIGLGIGLGLPSTLSAVRRAPNCAYRSNLDPPVTPPRTGVPVTLTDLLSTDADAFLSMPARPRLNPISSPPAMEPMSPLDLPSPLFLDVTISPPSAPLRPRHASFCFFQGTDRKLSATSAAFLAMADHAQLPLQRPYISSPLRGIKHGGPPTRGSQLQSTPEEVCEGDNARGIRRFEAVNPYFPAAGYCVSSGQA